MSDYVCGHERNPNVSATDFYMISSIEDNGEFFKLMLMSELSLVEHVVDKNYEIDIFDKNPQLNTEKHILNLIDLNYDGWWVENLSKFHTPYFCRRINFIKNSNFYSEIDFNYELKSKFKFSDDFNFHIEHKIIIENRIEHKTFTILEKYYKHRTKNIIFDLYCKNQCDNYNPDYYINNLNNPRYAHYILYDNYKAKKLEIENKNKKSIDTLRNLLYNLNTVEDNLEDFSDIKELMQSKLKWFLNKKDTEINSAWFEYELSLDSLDKSKLYTKYFYKGEM